MNITSEFFSFNMWEWFLHFLVLEWTESDLSKINWLWASFYIISIVLVPWTGFSLCHTPIRPISSFHNQISILIMGCVTMWSRGSHNFYLPGSTSIPSTEMTCPKNTTSLSQNSHLSSFPYDLFSVKTYNTLLKCYSCSM
jgi:hypothetical protein